MLWLAGVTKGTATLRLAAGLVIEAVYEGTGMLHLEAASVKMLKGTATLPLEAALVIEVLPFTVVS